MPHAEREIFLRFLSKTSVRATWSDLRHLLQRLQIRLSSPQSSFPSRRVPLVYMNMYCIKWIKKVWSTLNIKISKIWKSLKLRISLISILKSILELNQHKRPHPEIVTVQISALRVLRAHGPFFMSHCESFKISYFSHQQHVNGTKYILKLTKK